MAATLNPASLQTTFGYAMVDGQRVPVSIDLPWYLYLTKYLFERVGGYAAPTNVELAGLVNSSGAGFLMGHGENSGDTNIMIPGPQGQKGENGNQSVIMIDNTNIEYPQVLGQNEKQANLFSDKTASRALNTTYTNQQQVTIMVMASVRCSTTLGAGVAYVTALMDTASPPTVPASGPIGIEVGLLGENNSHQVTFAVNPGGTYRIASTTVTGTVVLGRWFELSL